MREASRRHPGLNLGDADRATDAAAEETLYGFWIFLMSDLVLFALLMATYAAMSMHGRADGPGPQDIVSLSGAFIETMLLLASSFTIGLASLALKYDDGSARLVCWLAVSFLLGAGFVGHEARELLTLATSEGAPPQRSGFLSAYYLLLGTHGLHVCAGLLWIIHSVVQLGVLGKVRDVKLRIMRLALFWHMLDIVWVAIFSFVFLAGLAR